jgi:hypothetical protein
MTEKPPSKDEALEALDFIVNVLKEHEKDLDRLISELGTVAGNFGDTGDLSGKVENVEEKISGLQNQITTLIKQLSTNPNTAQTQVTVTQASNDTANEATQTEAVKGTPIILQCKQWEDFQALATQAQTVSFTHKESEKTFEADALKNNQVITYTGELPKTSTLLKTWLSKQIDISEKKIIEGVLAIG